MIRITVALIILTMPVLGQIRSDFDRKMAAPTEPFRIIENIYYVGAADAAVYLITTDEGHFLLDSAFRENVPQIEAGIKKLGFRMSDIKIILNNHAHSDHAGGLALLKEKTGAKLYATKKQAKQLKQGGLNDFAFGDSMTFSPVTPDKKIRDGDQIKLGDVILTAHFTPGHTKGSTTFTTTVNKGDGVYQVIFVSSLSALDYDLISNKDYKRIADDFQSTFNLLRSMKVDIFLGSHAQFFKLHEKRDLLRSGPAVNPFVDPKGYRDFVARNEKSFLDKLKKQQDASAQK